MVLDTMWKIRQSGQGWLLASCVVFSSLGCASGPEEARQARIQNDKLDWMDRQSRAALALHSSGQTVRSQMPTETPVMEPPPKETPAATITITPVTSISVDDVGPARLQGEAQVRIVATIGTTPIYEREVYEAIYQRLPELMSQAPHEQAAKKKEMFNEELRRIIERELILDELFSMLNQKKQSSALTQLKEAANKDADARFSEIRKRAGLPNDDQVKLFFQSQGLTMTGVRRHFERAFMMSAFLGERLKPKIASIGLIDIKDYYEQHPEDFKTDDKVKWQDLFIRFDRFRSPEDAKKYIDWLYSRAKRGDDFVKLVEQFDMGDSKLRGSFGFGEERGKIFPPELEAPVFATKAGEVTIVPFETGYHLIRVAERTYAGTKPFDEQVQNEIRRKLQGVISEREYRKVVDTLWRKSQPQILVD
ncbi:MAG: peptidyl-prolyl cis-trans isomerase [Planctomycetes bacterium]|nr:peptidyl-prolyl cis-trans isomerase [Planctomycetota bacterium]